MCAEGNDNANITPAAHLRRAVQPTHAEATVNGRLARAIIDDDGDRLTAAHLVAQAAIRRSDCGWRRRYKLQCLDAGQQVVVLRWRQANRLESRSSARWRHTV